MMLMIVYPRIIRFVYQ